MKVIAIYNHKGGNGKTVTTVNLAYNLTERGYKVLVIDMDPQGNASAFFKKYDLTKPSVSDLLMGRKYPSRCVRRTKFKGLDIVPANVGLRDVSPEELIGGVETLKNACWALSGKYDFCIIDCPASIDYRIEIVMAAADDVIIPMKPDAFSADGLSTVRDLIDEFTHGSVNVGCLFTWFVKNKDTVRIVNDILGKESIKVYANVIRRNSAVDHSILVKRPLARCATKASATQDYRDFTREYLGEE